MLENLIKQLCELKPGKGEVKVGDSTLLYDIQPNGYSIKIISNQGGDKDIDKIAKESAENLKKKQIENLVNDFTASMNKINGDLFVEACDLYNEVSPMPLNELGKMLEEKTDFHKLKLETNRFKCAVNHIISKKVAELKSQIQKI